MTWERHKNGKRLLWLRAKVVVLLKATFMSLSDPQVSVLAPHPHAGFAKAGAEGDGH